MADGRSGHFPGLGPCVRAWAGTFLPQARQKSTEMATWRIALLIAPLWVTGLIVALRTPGARGIDWLCAMMVAAAGLLAATALLLRRAAERERCARLRRRDASIFAAAERARAEVASILATMPEGVLALDRRWAVRHVNDAALHLLQRGRADVLGALLWDLLPGWRESEFGERLQHAMQSGQSVAFAAAYPPLAAYFEVRCYPFDGGLRVHFRDNAELRETEEQLRQSQTLETLGQLTSGIAHDVNNLLTVILGNFEMLAMSAEERGEAGMPDRNLAESGRRAGESASELMRRLLAFSRRQPLSPHVVDVAVLLRSLERLLQGALGEIVALRIICPAGLWPTLVDPVELENAILNLAINARDAMPSGGRLTIEVRNVPVDRVYAAVAGLENMGDFIMLSVADTGHGMSRDVLSKAFSPFFTTKATGKGTGLGLSLVYGFAKRCGGHAIIDSEAGQGSIVRLYLPRTNGAEPPGAEAAETTAIGGGETILLVEDNAHVRMHTESMLRGLGYAVVPARDGPTALAMLRALLADHRPPPDLLLTDIVLPGGLGGRDLADAAAALMPSLRVLFTSGYPADVPEDETAMPSGVALVPKPFRRADLAARIRAQLACPPWSALGRAPVAG